MIREIVAEDIAALFTLRVATWHNANGASELAALGITPTTVRAQLATTHKGWVFEDHGAIVGFAMGDRSNGEMWVIAVLAPCEGRGIGKQLLRAVETWLFASGWEKLWLTTDLDPDCRAVRFYRSQGWSDWKLEGGDRFMTKSRT